MIKLYHYLFYRTFLSISRTNKTTPEKNAASYLSFIFLINIITLYFPFIKSFNIKVSYFILGIAVLVSFLNLNYFLKENKTKAIITEFKSGEYNPFWRYSFDFYPDISLLLMTKIISNDSTHLLGMAIFLLILRGVSYFSNL